MQMGEDTDMRGDDFVAGVDETTLDAEPQVYDIGTDH